ncbi:TPA: hypothetical protein DEO28_02505 [Candidatus Dependentiae bacterium]|nr:MAG: polymerase beta domain protein region protein [candidate division TM6 bacterium GW2011_GWE2_31_21]KKP53265.1 MAG: polymerase beta domain protein region protein [candidate division TM6 bacterium GW2011_GWF2_33_332]HBS48036.1 hypothetical protein [Candidatus Dependentiae bacterium]HBZ73361.1 hypothetical protein [Candidatus Dependentiae bacterium]
MKNNVSEDYKIILISIIQKYLPYCTIYLFGSRARGTNQSGADIDLALDNKQKIPFDTILSIYNDIDETTIPLFVDIVDINSASLDLKMEIEKEGIKWTN